MTGLRILDRSNGFVTMQISERKLKHLDYLDQTYLLARSIKRGMKQCETKSPMTVNEALDYLNSL